MYPTVHCNVRSHRLDSGSVCFHYVFIYNAALWTCWRKGLRHFSYFKWGQLKGHRPVLFVIVRSFILSCGHRGEDIRDVSVLMSNWKLQVVKCCWMKFSYCQLLSEKLCFVTVIVRVIRAGLKDIATALPLNDTNCIEITKAEKHAVRYWHMCGRGIWDTFPQCLLETAAVQRPWNSFLSICPNSTASNTLQTLYESSNNISFRPLLLWGKPSYTCSSVL